MNKFSGMLVTALLSLATVPSFAGTNLVVNGDFTSTSPRYFSSDYKPHSYPTPIASRKNGTGPGYFELGSDPSLDNSTWTGSAHTGSTFLLVDGSTSGSPNNGATSHLDGNARVWFESINVTGGTKYDLSAWGESFDNKNYADLIFTIGGKHGTQVGSNLQLGSTTNGWENLNATWVAPTTETISFAIVDKQTAASGNDFGLDNISFQAVPEASTVITFALLFLGGIVILRKRNALTTNA